MEQKAGEAVKPGKNGEMIYSYLLNEKIEVSLSLSEEVPLASWFEFRVSRKWKIDGNRDSMVER